MEHEQPPRNELLHRLQDALDSGDTLIFSRWSIPDTMERLEQIDTLYLDLDGTSLEQGATEFPPGFCDKLRLLHRAGVNVIAVTGKPETEIRALMNTVPGDIPLSFIFERGGYRIERASGESKPAKRLLLANAFTEETAATLKKEILLGETKQSLERRHGIRIVPAGDGRHQSLISIDILRADAPEKYEEEPRFDLKVQDRDLLEAVRMNIVAFLRGAAPHWELTDLGNANFELHHRDQTKENGIVSTAEFQSSTGMRMVVDDSANGRGMLRMKHEHPRMMSGVVYNRHTAPEIVELADVAVAGEATVDVLLQQIIDAKGVDERIYVISNTPPVQKKSGVFVTSIGAPVAISRAVEGTPNSLWLFPSKTPEDFREGKPAPRYEDLFRKCIPVNMTPAQHRSQYGEIANKGIWKASHPEAFESVPTFPEVDWDNYLHVNRNIAREVVASVNGSRDPLLIWVHDFQVAALASELRNMYDREKLKIGFFWHIPFPDAEVFIEGLSEGSNPRRAKQLLTWFSRYEVVGFHTEDYRQHYFEACRILGVPKAKAIVQPIGIDVEGAAAQARMVMGDPNYHFENPVLNEIFSIGSETGRRVEVILNGLERADPIKGTEPRLQALLDLANDRPELFDGKVILEGISESRTATDPLYAEYYNRCLRLIDQINDRLDHRDIVRQLATVSCRSDVIALLANVDKAMVTSVADGYNMVAAEILVTWNATRDMMDRRRTMFVSDRTGFVQSMKDNGFNGVVPVARGPIRAESLRAPIASLLAGETPEPDYEALTAYFDRFTIQKWVERNIREIRHSGTTRIQSIAG